ncbi:MAG: hypothetical protein JWQ21_635 [Herminiimonas sp.]|nr:hypothetical protein [Herminiimonas sp.]
MTMKALFEELGAPLNNPMWSWGAVREQDRTVVLRVWLDGTKKFSELGGKYYSWVSRADERDRSLGAAERRRHVNLIRDGYRAIMVMCIAEDDEAEVRTIREWDSRDLRVGGTLIEHNDELWLENVSRISIFDVKFTK